MTTKTIYLDCFAGISGDMAVGALLNCGVPTEILHEGLTGLDLGGYKIHVSPAAGNAISANTFRVEVEKDQPHRHWADIKKMLNNSRLKGGVKNMALAIFTTLAEAEAKVHNSEVEQVHFHEVGAVDSIIDIVGFAICLDHLAVTRVISSALPMGSGMISCAHGLLPLPAPAVCEILEGVPVYGVELQQELVTPTGAAIVKTVADSFGPFPSMTIARVGYGQGNHVLSDQRPNLLRVILGTDNKVSEAQEVEVIACNLDDWSPEGFPLLTEKLFKMGALDVVLKPIHMKKGRPGFQLEVICRPGLGWEARRCILSETTAIGLRYRTEKRWTLPRRTGTVETDLGRVAVKQVETPTGLALYPEYEDCRRLAIERNLPLKDIYAAVNRCQATDFETEGN
ncbi:MAG: nickel pincer cofactor biosynthesis protein LarC [Desulfobulbaceae bacterium]|nr:nickel pincer cofactor biosynthesis protein LarC [Desulfobulbaceae bacterium]